MARRGSGAPPIARARPCRKCGGDEWRKHKRGWRCIPCTRLANSKRERERYRKDVCATLWRKAKERAGKQGTAFTITVDDVRAAWPAGGRCPVLGIALARADGRLNDGSPTLDRLNSSWGYEPGNIAVISNKANRAKNNLTARELDRIVRWMRAHGLN